MINDNVNNNLILQWRDLILGCHKIISNIKIMLNFFLNIYFLIIFISEIEYIFIFRIYI